MSTNEIPNDYGLLDVLGSLCKSGRTGRLQIKVGSRRGAFFLRDGQLMDASVCTLTGFAAFNFAVSSGATVLNFDSSIEPPAPCFTDSNERRLLKTLFGIDAGEAELQSSQRDGSQGRLSLLTQASTVRASFELPVADKIRLAIPIVAPLKDDGVVRSYADTPMNRATAPLKGATRPLTAPLPPLAAPLPATAALKDASVPEPQTVVPLNVASVHPNPTTVALRDKVVPLETAGSVPKPAIAALQEAVVTLNAVAAAVQSSTPSLHDVITRLKDVNVSSIYARGAARRLDEYVKRASTSLLFLQPLSLWKGHAKSNLRAVEKKVADVSQSLQAQCKQSVSYLRNNKTAVRAVSIALIVIPAAVGFTSYWSKGEETVPLASPSPPAASSVQVPVVAPSRMPSVHQSIATIPITSLPTNAVRVRHDAPRNSEAAHPQRPARAASADTPRVISSETVAVGNSDTKESGAAEVKPSRAPEENQLPTPSSRGIAVEVRVEDGRVSEAFIKNRRPGLEGYEAAALRLARQRRYSKETTTTETLVIQVKGEH